MTLQIELQLINLSFVGRLLTPKLFLALHLISQLLFPCFLVLFLFGRKAGSGDPRCGQSMCMSGCSSVALRSTCSSAAGDPLCRRGTLPLGASSLVARSMRDPGSSSSALRSKSTNGASCPMSGHGFGSFSSSSLACREEHETEVCWLQRSLVRSQTWDLFFCAERSKHA